MKRKRITIKYKMRSNEIISGTQFDFVSSFAVCCVCGPKQENVFLNKNIASVLFVFDYKKLLKNSS